MAYSYTDYSGNGALTQFTVPFGYLDKAHVTVTVGGVTAAFTWLNDTTVVISPAPISGTNNIRVRRTTPIATLRQTFVDGSTLTQDQLNQQSKQEIYALQEEADLLALAVLLPSDPAYNAVSRQLPNPSALKLLGWDSGASALTNVDPGSQTLNVPASQSVDQTKLAVDVQYQVDTVAALKALTTKYNTVLVRGYYAGGDGGGGIFLWNSSDTTADNLGTVIIPNAGGTGRWNRVITDVTNVKYFGAKGDGVTNDYAAVAAALVYAKTGTRVYFPKTSVSYKINTGLTIPIGKVGLDFGGSVLDFSGIGAGVALTFTNPDNLDANDQVSFNAMAEVKNGYLLGNTSATAILIQDPTYTWIHNLRFSNGGVRNFGLGIQFGTGTFCDNFDGWSIVGCVTGARVVAGGSNYNERTTFYGMMFDLISGVALEVLGGGGGDVQCVACSFDYCGKMVYNSGAYVALTNCHIESNYDTDYMFYCTGVNPQISLQQCAIVISGNKSLKEIFWTDSLCGGIIVTDCHFIFGGNTYSLPTLCGGTGRAIFQNNTHEQSSVKPATALAANLIAYGDMENASAISQWVLSGGTLPTRSNLQAFSGSWSLRVNGTGGQNNLASYTTPFRSGRFAVANFVYKSTVAAGAATFYITLEYLSKSGAQMAVQAQAITTNFASWTRVNLSPSDPAPAGTDSVKLTFNVFGIGAAGCDCYVDDILLTEA